MTDILFCSFNRERMTRESFEALKVNTNWQAVNRLYILDDRSSDNTAAYLRQQTEGFKLAWPDVEVIFDGERKHGPVAAMNWYLDHSDGESESFIKIDNDFVVCPGWLDDVLRAAHLHPGVDIFGIQPDFGPPAAPPLTRALEECSHIGGIGLIRRRIFDQCRPVPRGRYGWTAFQQRHDLKRVWIRPDLPCFALDQLPFEPWLSLRQAYSDKGWQRLWTPYPDDGTFDPYWNWWRPVTTELAA